MKPKQRHLSKGPAAGRSPSAPEPSPASKGHASVSPAVGTASPAAEPITVVETDAPESSRGPDWRFGLFLLVVTLVAYWPALRGEFIWDDDTHISANPTLRTLHGLWEIWFVPSANCQYYPLSFTGFWIGYHLWGLHTLGYHLVNVLLHGTAAILLWQILTRLKVRGAWLAGALFALHPVCVMSVAWMTEFKNTLSCTMALLAGWAYLRAAGLGVYDQGKETKLDWKFYALSLALFQLAMFAKTAVSFLPVTLVLVSWWCGRKMNWRTVWPVLPMIGIGILMGLLTIHVEQSTKGGATGAAFHLTFIERVLVSGRSFWFYLGKLVYPHQLTFIYERWAVDAKLWWQYVYPAATAGLLVGLWLLRKRIGKGLLVALLHFYVATSLLILMLVLFFTSFSYVSDHWQYFGCLSVMGLAGAGIVRLLGLTGKAKGILEPVVCGVLLLTLGVLTWRQCGMYHNPETLWTETIKRSPNSALAENNYGSLLLSKGEVDKSMEYFANVLAVNPDDAVAHYNLGNALLQKGRLKDAEARFKRVLELQPDSSLAHNNLGNLLLLEHKYDDAIDHLQKAVNAMPSEPTAQFNLAGALAQKGRLAEAIPHLQKVVELQPNDAEARCNLGDLLLRSGRVDDGVVEFQAALKIHADYAPALNELVRIAWAWATSAEASARDGKKALGLAQQLVQVSDGKNALYLSVLAAADAETGNFAEAATVGDRARQLASQQGNTELVSTLSAQIPLYQSRQPFHQTGAPAAPAPPVPASRPEPR